MNWKVIVGLLLIFGGLKEFFSVGASHSVPAELGALTLALVGAFLVYKFRTR